MADRCCDIFRALGDPTRLKILQLLKQHDELCVSDICGRFEMTQPSISHHLDILKRARLVTSDKRGREIYYRCACDTIINCCNTQFRALDLRIERE